MLATRATIASTVDMSRIAVALLLALHAALHLLGFFKAWKLADLPQLSGRAIVPLSEVASRVVGILWLVACILLASAAAMRVARNEWWWTAAAAGILLSQGLVVLQWSDAKAGTIANVILGLLVMVTGATARFHDRAVAEVRAMFGATTSPSSEVVVRPEHLAGLPAPVRRWLERTGIVGRERARTVRLLQRGDMHTGNDAPWMPVSAEQYVSIDDPGFVWWMEARMMKVLPICGRDKYVGGVGEMLIKAGGVANVASDRGAKVDQGAMLRYLAEIVWYPSAALRPYIAWEPIDDTHAKATMTSHGLAVSAVYIFDEQGRALGMSADRYYGASGGLEKWGGECTDWRMIRDVEIPVRGQVVWYLKSGAFTFFRWEIVDAESNRPLPFGDERGQRGVREARAVTEPTRVP
jgi:hypothetical protein